MAHEALAAGRTAVITGGASGIGLAVAQALQGRGMSICIADNNAQELDQAAQLLGAQTLAVQTDVSDLQQVEALRDKVLERFGDVAFVLNNAGIGKGGGAFSNYAGWQSVMAVNLWGVIHGVMTFAPIMVEQERPAAIVNTGSKQGITNPPGNAAYNVAKAGVRSVTESLAHELRQIEECRVTAHLLVPGFTYTGLIRARVPQKPAAAWTPEQVAQRLLEGMDRGDFYVLCPDNDVTEAHDQARIQWHADDLIQNRPALSRWHPDYETEFGEFVENWVQS